MLHPLLFEINTRCWLRECSRKAGRAITLAGLPEEEFAQWKKSGFTHIWLMGVWTTGPKTTALAQAQPEFQRLCREHFQTHDPADIASSPYAIAEYSVDEAFGGAEGLRKFRRKLNRHGLRLILDFVPNHVGLDHPWLITHPDLFVTSAEQRPDTFWVETNFGPRWIAHGKDPYFPGWTDTAQLDYRNPATRAAMLEILRGVAAQCDGVRCDMAMLALKDVFAQTWSQFPRPHEPGGEFWREAIDEVKQLHPAFIFMAEAYWNLEGKLQHLGFDYTYDKIFYDHLVRRENHALHQHLRHDAKNFHTARFLENHDEPRIASLLTAPEQKAAAVLLLAQPGLRFLHDGQLAGRRLRTPVQLARYLPEAPNVEIAHFYEHLLGSLKGTGIGPSGVEFLKANYAVSDQVELSDCFVIKWQSKPDRFTLMIVNLAAYRMKISVSLPELEKGSWQVRPLLEDGQKSVACQWAEGRLETDLMEHGFGISEFFHSPENSPRQAVPGP